jgi:hypothetical protein
MAIGKGSISSVSSINESFKSGQISENLPRRKKNSISIAKYCLDYKMPVFADMKGNGFFQGLNS